MQHFQLVWSIVPVLMLVSTHRFKLQIKSSNIQTLLASGSNKTIGLIADPTKDLIILVQH